MTKVFFVTAFIFLFPVISLAQQNDDENGLYIKSGFTHINNDIEGLSFTLNGLSFDVEQYFSKNYFVLSGWTAGYRKDNLGLNDSGHLINGSIFRIIKINPVDFRLAYGIEWGVPSASMNITKFTYRDNELISYQHVSPKRNARSGLSPYSDAVRYPFIESSILKRRKRVMVEGGVRLNIQRFNHNAYYLSDDNFESVFGNQIEVISAIFGKIGVKIH